MTDNEKSYFVSKEGEQSGPFSLEQITEKIQKQELSPMDYIFDESSEDWVVLMQFEALQAVLAHLKPKAPPSKVQIDAKDLAPDEKISENIKKAVPKTALTEWYILKGDSKFGPFAQTDVVKMLQEKVVFEFDFAWHQGLETWQRIAELSEFSPEQIQKLQGSLMPEVEDVFFRRRHRRVDHGGTLLVHDNNAVWRGQSLEISSGGAGLVMENASIAPGQSLHLHFKPCDGIPAFNAKCEVVSKKFDSEVKGRDYPTRYGVKFTDVSPNTQKLLQEVSKKQQAA